MNQVEITGILTYAVAGQREFLLRLPGATIPLICQLETGVWKDEFPLGSHVCVKGAFASRDICKSNPCDCRTSTNLTESYIRVTSLTETSRECNTASVSGSLTENPRLVTVPSKRFYSSRIRLDDKFGFATITTEKSPGVHGDSVTVSGRLQIKDYRRHLECPCCGKTGAYPILSVIIRENKRDS